MASQSVLELAVNTGKWDSGLKKAKSALDNFTTASGGLQQALGKDSDKMQKFVQMMGSMDSKAMTAKGQMNDYKGTIEQLTMQYNRMTEAQQKTIGQDYLRAIDQLRQKYQSVNQEVQQMNRNLTQATSTPKGGISSANPFGNLTSKFTKANIYAMAAEKGVEAFQQLGSHIVDVMGQAQKLSAESEGIRNAFERLNRPDLLDKLREATHGTVSDLELMKQAVKFSDFKLSLDDLGTLLAFAQQKAKDTGQSVDFMVDSIVTGLGRKSLMILDNLGLSASEVKERMKETGDMTKAVADIIREQMRQAGEYTETASDRLARAIADNENAMMKLGDAMRDTFGAAGWDELSASLEKNLIVELTEVVKNLGEAKKLINDIIGSDSGFGELASTIGSVAKEVFYWGTGIYEIWRLYNKFKGEDKPVLGSVIGNIAKSPQPSNIQPLLPTGNKGKGSAQVFGADTIGAMEQYISELQKKWKAAGEDVRDLYTAQIENARNVLAQMKGEMPEGSLAALNRQISDLRKEQSAATNTETWKAYEEQIRRANDQVKAIKGELAAIGVGGLAKAGGVSITGGITDSVAQEGTNLKTADILKPIANLKVVNDGKDLAKQGEQARQAWSLAAQAVSSVGDAFNSIEDPGVKAMGTITQAIASIALGFAQASVTASSLGPFGWVAFLAAGAAALATTISTVHSLTNLSEGGFITGNSYSGDNIKANGGYVGLNAGELVLNTSQQNNLANALQGNRNDYAESRPYVTGEMIYLALNNYMRRSGHGEILKVR